MCRLCLPFIVSTGPEVQDLQDLPGVWLWSFVACSLPFVLSPALLSVRWLEICPYLAFNGFLTGFLLLDVCLYYLRALRGLCGFCTRVELGGFMACCVFA